jgi:hypothetical protein
MTTDRLTIPREEAWLIRGLAEVIAERLVTRADAPEARRGLLRAIWSLQRLPAVAPGVTWGLSIGDDGGNSVALDVSAEGLSFARFDDGSTVANLNYFQCSHDYRESFLAPEGEARRRALEALLRDFREYLLESGHELFVEDLCDGPEADRVPLGGTGTDLFSGRK